MKKNLFALLALIPISACKQVKEFDNALDYALSSEDPKIKAVLANSKPHEIQIQYTQILRDSTQVSFKDYNYNLEEDAYFYPASTVKFPAAVAALEKLNALDSLDRDTRFYVEGDSVVTTFTADIDAIFAVSDNEANNRLIEFLGFDDLNKRMRRRGVAPIRIAHRLSTSNADDVTTKPLVIYQNDSITTMSTPIISGVPEALTINGTQKGSGYYASDSLMQGPFDFGLKNYYPVKAQHALLKRVLFPEAFAPQERFDLTEEQRQFLIKSMGTLPHEVGYDRKTYYDSYGKFFLFGDSEAPMPEHIRIHNKVGYAYGTLTDCAYIHDSEKGVEFLVTATILVNEDGIFNDNNYEYDTLGIPFLAQLGREIYQYEIEHGSVSYE
ncbi:MAG: serine hydrolase [Bacteroidota bacterium]